MLKITLLPSLTTRTLCTVSLSSVLTIGLIRISPWSPGPTSSGLITSTSFPKWAVILSFQGTFQRTMTFVLTGILVRGKSITATLITKINNSSNSPSKRNPCGSFFSFTRSRKVLKSISNSAYYLNFFCMTYSSYASW